MCTKILQYKNSCLSSTQLIGHSYNCVPSYKKEMCCAVRNRRKFIIEYFFSHENNLEEKTNLKNWQRKY